MHKTELFIENHTLPVLISLILVIVCCFIAVFFIEPTRRTYGCKPDDTFISDENGERISYNISSEEDARQFAEIYLRNTFPDSESDEYFSASSIDSRLIYRNPPHNAFDGYYSIYPAASVNAGGTVKLHIHRILHKETLGAVL